MKLSGDVSPDWSRLPFEPVIFFGLEEGFDRKALKRKYNSLIKVFKPEKSPDEFQKIRAAFEMLDGELRYGKTNVVTASSTSYSWNTGGEVPVDDFQAEKASNARKAAKKTIVERLESELPVEIYKELNRKEAKQPFDYYALAIISDIVSKDKTLFVKWLLTGLNEFKGDPGLLAVLLAYYQEDHPKDVVASLLLTTSKVINDDLFFFATEKLWAQLLVKQGFDAFESTLKRCESNLKGFRIECKLAFYVCMIRKAIWSASKEWIDQAFEFLNENFQEIPSSLEFDVEFLFALRDYYDAHLKILSDDKVRKRIHKALVSYFTLPEKDGDLAIIRCQTFLSNDGSSLLDSFPLSDEDAMKLYYPWDFVNQEVCQRHSLDQSTNLKKLRQSVYDLCLDLDASSEFGVGDLLQYHAMTKGPYLLFFCLPFALLWQWLDQSWAVWVSIILAVALVVLGHIFLQPSELFTKSMQRRVERLYNRNWRNRFIQILESSQAYPHELSDAIISVIEQKHEDMGLSSWLYEHVPRDSGLAFYAMSTRFVK